MGTRACDNRASRGWSGRNFAALAIGAGLVTLLGGCGSSSGNETASSAAKPSGASGKVEVKADESPDQKPAAIADGLETLWWIADDSGGAVGRKLAAYVGNKPALDDAELARLRAMGLRAVVVPLKELDGLRASMTAAGQTQRRWLGQLPDWTVLVQGLNYPQGLVAMVGKSKVELDPGRLRWLVRAWTTPVTRMEGSEQRIGAALHAELVPQMEETTPRYERLLEQAAKDGKLTLRSTGPERDGLMIESARITLEMETSDAVVLVPESPEVDWLAEVEPSDRTGRSAAASGPTPGATITLGEAMLSQDTAAGGRVKVVVALIPRLPERFRLIGR